MSSPITTHVLDTSLGKPAAGVRVILDLATTDGGWRELARSTTNTDGRVNDLLAEGSSLHDGVYRLTFFTGEYFRRCGTNCFYPKVVVEFEVKDGGHHHVPLLLSPFGFSTYKGS